MSDEIEFGEYREAVSESTEPTDSDANIESENDSASHVRTTRSTDNRLRVMENRIEYMMQSVYGIMWAALAYFSIHLVFVFFIALYHMIVGRFYGQPGEAFVGLIYATIGLSVIGFVAGIAGCVSVLIVNFINWTLGYIFTIRESIIVTGGVVGYWIMAAPFLVFTSREIEDQWALLLLWFHIGPVLGCIFGSVGAVLWEAKRTRRRYHTFFDDRPVFQFGMRHILIITAWAAIVLGFSQASKLMMLPILTMLWLFWQGVILFCHARMQSQVRKETNVAIQWQSNVRESQPKLELVPETELISESGLATEEQS